jgi:hypothetical protein
MPEVRSVLVQQMPQLPSTARVLLLLRGAMMKKGKPRTLSIAKAAIMAGMMLVLGITLGRITHTAPVTEPHRGIWIEFENLQHALDAAARLGGTARGLTVCMQTKEEATGKIWNPHISVTGDLESCAFKRRETDNYGMVISNLSFDGTRGTISAIQWDRP